MTTCRCPGGRVVKVPKKRPAKRTPPKKKVASKKGDVGKAAKKAKGAAGKSASVKKKGGCRCS